MQQAAAATRQRARRAATLRQRLNDAIEAAIEALDALDADPDLELEPDLEDGADAESDHVAHTVAILADWPPGFDPAHPNATLPGHTI